MGAVNRLYKKDNYTVQKCISLEDKLYTSLKEIADKEYDATISDLVNICVEDYITRNNPQYYPKPDGEITIYRSIMLRKNNIDGLNELNRKTGISVTRLINASIREFIDNRN